jgi:hypothetical protein
LHKQINKDRPQYDETGEQNTSHVQMRDPSPPKRTNNPTIWAPTQVNRSPQPKIRERQDPILPSCAGARWRLRASSLRGGEPVGNSAANRAFSSASPWMLTLKHAFGFTPFHSIDPYPPFDLNTSLCAVRLGGPDIFALAEGPHFLVLIFPPPLASTPIHIHSAAEREREV